MPQTSKHPKWNTVQQCDTPKQSTSSSVYRRTHHPPFHHSEVEWHTICNNITDFHVQDTLSDKAINWEHCAILEHSDVNGRLIV